MKPKYVATVYLMDENGELIGTGIEHQLSNAILTKEGLSRDAKLKFRVDLTRGNQNKTTGDKEVQLIDGKDSKIDNVFSGVEGLPSRINATFGKAASNDETLLILIDRR